MLINITTPNLSDADKAFLTAAFEQSDSTYAVCAVCTGDGVYAPALHPDLFVALARLAQPETTLRVAVLDSDAASRGAQLPEHITLITLNEFAALSANYTQWVTL